MSHKIKYFAGITGIKETYTTSCILTTNLIYEKVYIVLFIWLCIVSAVGCIWFLIWLLTMAVGFCSRLAGIFGLQTKFLDHRVIISLIYLLLYLSRTYPEQNVFKKHHEKFRENMFTFKLLSF